MTDVDDRYIKRLERNAARYKQLIVELETTVEGQHQLIEGLKKSLKQQIQQTFAGEHSDKVIERIFSNILTDMVLDVAEEKPQ